MADTTVARRLARRARAGVRRARAGAQRARDTLTEERLPIEFPTRLPTPVRLLVGPANFAGQGWAWAQAAQLRVPGVGAQAFAVRTDRLDFPADYTVPRETFVSPRWQRAQRRFVTDSYTHVLIEAARPVLGARPPYGDRCTGDLPILRAAGLNLAMLAHGSDVRVPSEHVARYSWSPFKDLPAARLKSMEHNSTANRALMREHDGPVYVSTPDLLDELPAATWLPVVVDPRRWRSERAVLERPVPVVVHAPSSSPMKGSDLVDPLMAELHSAGAVEYRRLRDLDPEGMPGAYGDADIVLDQFRLGSYGVAACEAMAAGRVVVGHVTEVNRARVRELSGHDLPIVEATPETLQTVVRELVADRERSRAVAGAGVEFVEAVHDGRVSADLLRPFLLATPAG